eukprot:COSAG06_NODE_54504_length_294_cov_0.794872_1_plen_64_part_01
MVAQRVCPPNLSPADRSLSYEREDASETPSPSKASAQSSPEKALEWGIFRVPAAQAMCLFWLAT